MNRVAVLLCAAALAGCATTVELAPLPPETYENLGPVTGDGCGALLFGDIMFAFIPIGLQDRVKVARLNALAKTPEATMLINVTIKERWYWWVIGSSRCATISGEAIKS